MKLKPQVKAILIVALVASLFIGVVAAAGYLMTAPNSDPFTSNPTPTPKPSPTPTPVPDATLSKVSLSTYTIVAGESFTMSTTSSDGLAGIPVNFYASDGTFMGTAATNAAGTASLTTTINAAWTGTFYATAQHP